MADCQDRQQPQYPQQGPCAFPDQNSPVRQSIEYLRRTSQVGTEDSTAFPSGKRTDSSFPEAAGRHAGPVPQQEQEEQSWRGTGCSSSRFDDNVNKELAGWQHQRRNQEDALLQMQQQPQQQQQPPRDKVNPKKRGRLMLIIDVQSKRGAVEEVYCREGDNCFDLAKGFIMRCDLTTVLY